MFSSPEQSSRYSLRITLNVISLTMDSTFLGIGAMKNVKLTRQGEVFQNHPSLYKYCVKVVFPYVWSEPISENMVSDNMAKNYGFEWYKVVKPASHPNKTGFSYSPIVYISF